MVEKMRELVCDPLKCFATYLTINIFFFSMCATGYWNLDRKIEELQKIVLQVVVKI